MKWWQSLKKGAQDNYGDLKGVIAHYEILFYSIPFALSIGWITNWIYNQYLTGSTIKNELPALTIGIYHNSNFSNVGPVNIPIIWCLISVFLFIGLLFSYRAYKKTKNGVDEYGKKSKTFLGFIYLSSMALILAVTLGWTGNITEIIVRKDILQGRWLLPTLFITYLAAIAFFQLSVDRLKIFVIALILSATLVNTLYNQSELSIFFFYLASLVVTGLLIVDTYKKYIFPKNLLTETNASRECHHLILPLSNWSLLSPNNNKDVDSDSFLARSLNPKQTDAIALLVNDQKLLNAVEQLTKTAIIIKDISINQYEDFYKKQLNTKPNDKVYLALFTEMLANFSRDICKTSFDNLISVLNGEEKPAFRKSELIYTPIDYRENKTSNESTVNDKMDMFSKITFTNKQLVLSSFTISKLLQLTTDFAKYYQLNKVVPFSAWYLFIGKFLYSEAYNNWEMSAISIDYFISPCTKGKNNKLKQISVFVSSDISDKHLGSYSVKGHFIDLLNQQFNYYELNVDTDFYWIERESQLLEKDKIKEQTEVIRQNIKEIPKNDMIIEGNMKHGVDFNSFYDVSFVIASILREHDKTYKERFTTLDFTGGQKITSTVMSFYATTTKIKNQTVDTNDYSVTGYDFVYQDINSV